MLKHFSCQSKLLGLMVENSLRGPPHSTKTQLMLHAQEVLHKCISQESSPGTSRPGGELHRPAPSRHFTRRQLMLHAHEEHYNASGGNTPRLLPTPAGQWLQEDMGGGGGGGGHVPGPAETARC